MQLLQRATGILLTFGSHSATFDMLVEEDPNLTFG